MENQNAKQLHKRLGEENRNILDTSVNKCEATSDSMFSDPKRVQFKQQQQQQQDIWEDPIYLETNIVLNNS